jgi:hypothetical protein
VEIVTHLFANRRQDLLFAGQFAFDEFPPPADLLKKYAGTALP